MNVYYEQAVQDQPDRHRILTALREINVTFFDPAPLPPWSLLTVDEIPANQPGIEDLAANLSQAPPPLGSGLPMPPYWQVVTGPPPGLRRLDGSVWVPAPNTDKNEFLADAPALIDRLQEIEDTVVGSTLVVTQRALKDVSKGLRQTVKYLKRTLKHE
jgi:hypothetical protein